MAFIKKKGLIGLAFIGLCACVSTQSQDPRAQGGIGPGPHTPGSSHPRIKSKPNPMRPAIPPLEETTIVITGLFRKDGKVTDLKFVSVRPLSTSKENVKLFTRLCKEAAREITFQPALQGGKPVSMQMKLEYVFRQNED